MHSLRSSLQTENFLSLRCNDLVCFFFFPLAKMCQGESTVRRGEVGKVPAMATRRPPTRHRYAVRRRVLSHFSAEESRPHFCSLPPQGDIVARQAQPCRHPRNAAFLPRHKWTGHPAAGLVKNGQKSDV